MKTFFTVDTSGDGEGDGRFDPECDGTILRPCDVIGKRVQFFLESPCETVHTNEQPAVARYSTMSRAAAFGSSSHIPDARIRRDNKEVEHYQVKARPSKIACERFEVASRVPLRAVLGEKTKPIS
jgi:hypothetical protein